MTKFNDAVYSIDRVRGYQFVKLYISMFEKWLESPQWLLAVSKPEVRMRVTSAWGQEYHNAGMEHGLKDIVFYLGLLYILRFYFEKHIIPHAVCHNFSLVRDKPLGSPACPKRVYQGRQLQGCELFRPCSLSRRVTRPLGSSLGYLLIYPPQIATVMKPMSFCSMYSPVSHIKSLGESREWNMVFQGYIWYRLKAF